MLQYGIDCSNWSGVPSQAALDKLVELGYNWAVPGTQRFANGTGYTTQQIAALEGAGIKVPAVYCYLYFDGRDLSRIEHALTFGKYVWLDVEETNATPEVIQACIDHANQYVAGIYTGRYIPLWQNTTAFKNLPLWHAEYPSTLPNDMSTFFETFPSYAGWNRPAIWQFRGTTQIEGFGVDLNVYYEQDIITPPPPPSPTVDHFEVHMSDGAIRKFYEP